MRNRYPQVYLDFQIGTQAAGRVIFELFNDVTPKTAENFRGLCSGEYGHVGMGKKTKRLHYLHTQVFRIVDNMMIQGGDIINNDGTGGASIYGATFVDENFSRRHACAGLLSMANRGRNTNNSQFYITLKPCPHLDGKHVVFGQVIDGIDVIKKIGQVPVDMQDRPKVPVLIVNCGEVAETKNWLICDPFSKEIMEEIHKDRLRSLYGEGYVKELEDEEEEKNKLIYPEKYAQAQNEQKQAAGQKAALEPQEVAPEDKESEEVEEADKPQEPEPQEQQVQQVQQELQQPEVELKIGEHHLKRLQELRQRIQQSKVLNDKAVLDEEKANTDAQYDKYQRKRRYLQKLEKEKEELEFKQIDQDRSYLNRMMLKPAHETEQKKESFGWDVFNDDAVYNAYKKRCTSLVKDQGKYEDDLKNPAKESQPSQEALERLATDIQHQQKKRAAFSRRRRFNEDQPVTYINERNRIFNQKLQRFFGEYAADIKANLERGTAS